MESTANSNSIDDVNEQYLKQIFEIIIKTLKRNKKGEGKIIDFHTPDNLKKLLDFTLPDKGLDDQKILTFVQNVINLSVQTTHRHFFNVLFGGFSEYSLSGEFITALLNGTMYSYEMAPVFNFMEQEIIQKMAFQFIQWNTADGIFAPGGSLANFYSILAARHYRYPEHKQKGMRSLPELKLFTNELGHYSIEKAAIMLGFGLESVVKINSDEQGKIIPQEFEKAIKSCIEQNQVPLFLNLTMGTTVYGAIDNMNECIDIAKKYNIWVHVDGDYGGHMIFLKEIRDKLSEIKQIDSFAWDPHKVFNVPQQCSVFMTKHEGLLNDCNSLNSDYLFMKDKKLYDAKKYDSGDKSFMCARHIDVLKFWLYWQHYGTLGLEKLIRDAMNNAKYFADLVKKHPNFELILEPEYIAVQFNYYPDRFLNRQRDEQFWKELVDIPPQIKAKMVKEGTMMIAYQKQKRHNEVKQNFFRIVLTVDKTKDDAEFAIKEIHRLGKDL